MTQKELVCKIAAVLRASGRTKHIKQSKKTFKIIDPRGVEKSFVMTEPDFEALYTNEDVYNVLKGLVEVVTTAVRTGDRARIAGLFTVFSHFRDEYVMKSPTDGKFKIVPAHYTPKFVPAQELRRASKDYANFLRDKQIDEQAVMITDDSDDYYDEFEDMDDDLDFEEDYVSALELEEIVDDVEEVELLDGNE